MTIIFVFFVVGLGYVLGRAYGDSDSGMAGLVLAFMVSTASALFSFFAGDKVALWTAGAKPLAKEDNAYVYRLVENLCIASGLPMPKIYLIDESSPNAFATGRDPKHASIALTTGIIAMMKNEELEGVIAHELSHVKNYDIRVMTMVIVLAGTIALMSNWFLRSMWWGGRRSRDEKGNNAIFLLIGIILALLSPLAAKLIQLAVSRQREYLADASGALLTRYPEGLASALEKIAGNGEPLLHANHATAHLYIANPFGPQKTFLNNLFSTHPPIADRIKVLRQMA